MTDLKTIEGKVLVDADRYEELIKTEARVEAVVRILDEEHFISAGQVLRILGFSAIAEKIEREDKARYEEICEMDNDL